MEVSIKDESFRDHVGTISKEGKRRWIYPKKPKGTFYNKRTVVSVILLTLLFTGPFMRLNGHPFLMLNVLERKFILFGVPFWPQDFFLFVLAMLTFFVFIILFTAVFGRVFCGWACPQTIFMEMVFRKIEYAIEGDAQQQKALNSMKWTPEKIKKKFLKHGIFFLISFLIANTFLAYIISIDKLKLLVTEGPSHHLAGLTSLIIFTGIFYGVYSRFREQACLVVCPYGRLQGVLLDRNSIVIAYDYRRGEPRGKIHKNEERKIGDCVDCSLCVAVCPTGIDIRNGTQLECINCTACIDACDTVMDKVGMQKGLIRYASENNIADRAKFKITPRLMGYSAILVILFGSLVTLLALRSDLDTTILRTPGQMFQKVGDDKVSNLYNIQMVNKTYKSMDISLKVEGYDAQIEYVGKPLDHVGKDSLAEGVFFIVLPKNVLTKLKTPLVVEIWSNGKLIDTERTNFLGPNNN